MKYGSNIVIVHFNPIDKYPPAVNCVRYLAQQNDRVPRITIITTTSEKTHWHLRIPGVTIKRTITLLTGIGKFRRVLKYLIFNVKALYELLLLRPDTILYYETLSAWAPYIYVKWLNKSCHLFIHYHEYISPYEYKHNMLLNRWLHNLEKNIYSQATWVSHTNDDRMRMFLNDIHPIVANNTYILPNYPPRIWKEKVKENLTKHDDMRIGFVYVGALSFQMMYTKNMIDFVRSHADKFYWDIYSDNHQEEVFQYIESTKATNIYIKGPVVYDDLPNVLCKYNIGVILYDGSIPNHVYSAPNKLFEYYACGLDVWFSPLLKGTLPYICNKGIPKIVPIDFENITSSLSQNVQQSSITETGLYEKEYYCEEVLEPLWSAIKGKS